MNHLNLTQTFLITPIKQGILYGEISTNISGDVPFIILLINKPNISHTNINVPKTINRLLIHYCPSNPNSIACNAIQGTAIDINVAEMNFSFRVSSILVAKAPGTLRPGLKSVGIIAGQ